jgi:hypothetical protein
MNDIIKQVVEPYMTAQAEDQREASEVQEAVKIIRDCSNRVIEYVIDELKLELEERK